MRLDPGGKGIVGMTVRKTTASLEHELLITLVMLVKKATLGNSC